MKFSKISKLSAFARAESHLVQHTYHGAIVTVMGVLLAAFLFQAEVRLFFSPKTIQTMDVDLTREEALRITFNLTFPHLACQALNMDVSDVTGDHASDESLAKNGEVHKWRLNAEGVKIGLGEYVAPRYYGFQLRKSQEEIDALDKAMDAHEGCNLHGWVLVKWLAGNFHFSIHAQNFFSMKQTQEHLAEALKEQIFHTHETAPSLHWGGHTSGINMSHTIHKLEFGPRYPGMINPLDGVDRMLGDDASGGMFKYFLKIVPTVYKGTGHSVHTNQFSVTEYYTADRSGQLQLPSVYFLYDFSPIIVTIAHQRRSLLHLLTRICAVVGGVFAVTGMLDKWVHFFVTKVISNPPSY